MLARIEYPPFARRGMLFDMLDNRMEVRMGVQISDDIARYRKMLSASKDETEQQIIFKLLNEEIAKQTKRRERPADVEH
jgi:hypothetical protein